MTRAIRAERRRRATDGSRRRVLVTVVASGALLLLATVPAFASCIRDDRPLSLKVAEAEIVFVGTVLTVDETRRTARVQVEEIWRGSELGEQVVVHGGPRVESGDGAAAVHPVSSVDRHWEPGARYLVFPQRYGEGFSDDACSATIPWEPQLSELRPDDAHPFEQQGRRVVTTAQPAEWVFVGVAVIVLVVGIGWLTTRHARRPPLDG